MASGDVVRITRLARDHARESMDRLERHLARGPRGRLGVAREVNFLNALDRQSMRVAANATNIRIAPQHQGLGDRALARLQGPDARHARSGLLGEFSDDIMLHARLTRDGSGWYHIANHSACAACLVEHGEFHRDTEMFVPIHPSCMCFPEPASTTPEEVRTLSEREMANLMIARGGRDARLGRALLEGALPREEVRVRIGTGQWRQQTRIPPEEDVENLDGD